MWLVLPRRRFLFRDTSYASFVLKMFDVCGCTKQRGVIGIHRCLAFVWYGTSPCWPFLQQKIQKAKCLLVNATMNLTTSEKASFVLWVVGGKAKDLKSLLLKKQYVTCRRLL